MIDSAQKRGEIVKHLEDGIALADELEDGATGYLIERALDEARSRQYRHGIQCRRPSPGPRLGSPRATLSRLANCVKRFDFHLVQRYDDGDLELRKVPLKDGGRCERRREAKRGNPRDGCFPS